LAALPSLRQLRYLTALADHLNFTRAAEACFVSQSTLSAGLKELENTLGVQLVERDRQSVAMTPEGERLLERARGLLAAAEDLVEAAQDASHPMQGTLRLGVIPTIAPFLLPTVLPELRQLFPKLKLALREDLTENLLARLRDRQLDFALIALPYDTDGLISQALFDDEFLLVARPDDPAVTGQRVSLPARVAERLLLLEEGHCLREHTLLACRGREAANAEGIEATSLLTLIQMVESNMGIALIPEMAVKGGLLKNTSLVARPVDAPAPRRVIALIARQSSPHLAEFKALADAMTATRQRAGHAVISALGRRKRKH
jgi:LysR family transcriptional regulator, hydrogen peroxide-inducible genes activator